jgi:hypothetical protein
MLVNILAEGIRILAEGILAGMRSKNCDFVHNPLGRLGLGLTLDKTKK